MVATGNKGLQDCIRMPPSAGLSSFQNWEGIRIKTYG